MSEQAEKPAPDQVWFDGLSHTDREKVLGIQWDLIQAGVGFDNPEDPFPTKTCWHKAIAKGRAMGLKSTPIQAPTGLVVKSHRPAPAKPFVSQTVDPPASTLDEDW